MERPIEASTTIRVAYARARQALLDDPGSVFRETRTGENRRGRQFREDLSVDLAAGASVHQEVTLQLDVARFTEAGLVLPLTWQPIGRKGMLPTFNGELQVSEAREGTGLRLSGTYTVPLGAVGRFGDALVGRRIARRSLRTLVQRLAGCLDSEVKRRVASVAPHSQQLAHELYDNDHPEIYVG